jgi:hypothetical protein
MTMRAAGTSLREVRRAIDAKHAGTGKATPTPLPP